jgi:hypothetical protein
MSAARKALDRSFVTLLTDSVVTQAEKAKTTAEAIEGSKRSLRC